MDAAEATDRLPAEDAWEAHEAALADEGALKRTAEGLARAFQAAAIDWESPTDEAALGSASASADVPELELIEAAGAGLAPAAPETALPDALELESTEAPEPGLAPALAEAMEVEPAEALAQAMELEPTEPAEPGLATEAPESADALAGALEPESTEAAGAGPASAEPMASFVDTLELSTFLGDWWDSMGSMVHVAQGSDETVLDVKLTRQKGNRPPIKLQLMQQGAGHFVCGQYELDVSQSSTQRMFWHRSRLGRVMSSVSWAREREDAEMPAGNPAEPFMMDVGPRGKGNEPRGKGAGRGGNPGCAPARADDPYPYLTQYFTRQRKQLQSTGSRYYANGAACSDDGRPDRSAFRNRCAICLEVGHGARDCPRQRCGICFCTGHDTSECGQALEKEAIDDRLVACWNEALDIAGNEDSTLRCFACWKGGTSHVNCVPGPTELPELVTDIQFEAEEHLEQVQESLPEGEVGDSQPPRKRLRADAGGEEEAPRPQPVNLANADEVTALFAHWGRPAAAADEPADQGGGEAGKAARGSGRPAAGVLGSKVLRFLAEGTGAEGPWREELSAAPAASVTGAVRELWRCGAVLPGAARGLAPQLTALGWWLAPLPVPPSAACALLHGALWGVLLPMAALVVLLESVPPDLALGDGKAPPRKSGHFALAAAYFRWREGRETQLSRRFGADVFWETVDQRIVAICKHAQQALHYDGDDAAFEEMDGELMDVRRRDGRPWTWASAFGSDASVRWARFRAALSAASAPQPGERSGEWVVRTQLGTGAPPLETVVTSGHALLFAAGELGSADAGSTGQLELCGLHGSLCGGEGALEEARALRQELGERLSQALEGASGPRAEALDEAFVGQVLHFASSSASEFVSARGLPAAAAAAAATGSEGDVGTGLLTLLGRQPDETPGDSSSAGSGATTGGVPGRAGAPVPRKEAAILELAARCLAQPAGAGGEADVAAGRQGASCPPAPPLEDPGAKGLLGSGGGLQAGSALEAGGEEAAVKDWAAALARASLLRALKRRAADAEDFSLAARLKACEASAAAAVVAGRERAGTSGVAQRAAALEGLKARKRQAVQEEDYELAARLKQQEAQLAKSPAPPAAGELERVKVEKQEAIAQEDYERASVLRERQSQLEASWKHYEETARAQAAAYAADTSCHGSLLALADWWGSGADAAAWAEVAAELQAAPIAGQ